MASGWRFWLCDTDTMDEIVPMTQARNRSLEVVRNSPGKLDCVVPLDSEEAKTIYRFGDKRGTVRTAIKAKRDGESIWSGPIYTLNPDLLANTLSISCVGWLEQLIHRELRQDFNYATPTPSATMAYALLAHANTVDPLRPTYITAGTFTGTDTSRTANFTKGSKVGPSIMSLSELESGFDVDVDPETRQLNLFAWNSYLDRDDVHLGFNWGPDNLQNVIVNEDASRIRNRLTVTGSSSTTPAVVQDDLAADDFWLSEETISLGDVNSNSVLLGYAGAEVAVLGRPLVTYTITPKSGQSSFVPFETINLGDKIYFSAKRGYYEIQKQAIRVFGFGIDIDSENNEKIREMYTSPTGA
jgi:hypothetical protein